MALFLCLRRALPFTLTRFPKNQNLADPSRWQDGLGGTIIISNSLVNCYSSAPPSPTPTALPPNYPLPDEFNSIKDGKMPTAYDIDNNDDAKLPPSYCCTNFRTGDQGYHPRRYYRGVISSHIPGTANKILRFKEDPIGYPLMKEYAALALKEYTRQTGDIYELVDIDKVNYLLFGGCVYYMTFKAKSQKETKTFEAEVEPLGEVQQICSVRIKKPGGKWSDGKYNVPSDEELSAGWCERNCGD